ncbi:MAG: hypothetical protein ACLVB1_09805 [Blautia obeum]
MMWTQPSGAGVLCALGIKAYLEKNDISGTVLFYGCPGEEGAAKALWQEMVWKKLMWHLPGIRGCQ